MKDLLRQLVDELEELRANQAVLTAHVGKGVSKDVAQIEKNAAIASSKQFFDKLRTQIEAL